MLSSGDSFPHLIQKPRSQLGFVTYLLNRPRMTPLDYPEDEGRKLLRNGCNYTPINTTSHIQEKGILQWK
jgi:hypothetical protein